MAVAGNIGCGKSTLVDFICRTYGVRPFFEPNANNPFLKDFYGDMRRWAFHSQIYFLTHKFRILKDLENQRSVETVVLDRTIYEDAEVFAAYLHRRRFIGSRDWEVYQDLYRAILSAIQPPDFLIYLRASTRAIRQRIKVRGRPEEQSIPATYLRSLNKLYEEWFSSYRHSPVVILDTDKLDYITDLEHLIDVRRSIEKYLG